ncbi:MAG: hypothetical protein DI498_05020 [Paracoccus denitrificans]|nr:MAG: hypothetical protein DI498_05020 [Paracoccus denitrificans]PZO85281.1 MAG: hypothetical protein DI633_05020 [Paracoccus denitrificans]
MTKPPAAPNSDPRKTPAAPGTLKNSPVEAGTDAKPAQGKSITTAIDSSLVGASDGVPAATRKPQPDAPLRLTNGDKSDVEVADADAAATPTPVVSADTEHKTAERLIPRHDNEIDAVPSHDRDTAARDFAKPTVPAPLADAPRTTRDAPAVPAARRGGFWPLFLGGVIAAALGAGATYWAIPRLPAQWQPAGAPAVATGVDEQALDQRFADLRAESENAARAAAEAAVNSAGASLAPEALRAAQEAGADAARTALADLPAPTQGGTDPAQVAQLTTTIEAQAQRIAALESTVQPLTTSDVPQRLSALDQQIKDLAARPDFDPAVAERLAALIQQADAAQAKLNDVESEAGRLQQAAEDAARQARANSAATIFTQSLDTTITDDQRAAALADLEQAGVAANPALQAPVVPLDQLKSEFEDAAQAGLRAALRAGSEGTGNAFVNFLKVQTGAHSVEPKEGSDPDAVLSRARAKVADNDIAAALSEIDALPEVSRTAMTEWTAKARAWIAARDAVGALTTPADTNPSSQPAATN